MGNVPTAENLSLVYGTLPNKKTTIVCLQLSYQCYIRLVLNGFSINKEHFRYQDKHGWIHFFATLIAIPS